MSDDELEHAPRRSPRKGDNGLPMMAVDAARNIVRNKTTQKGTKRDAAQKTSSARNTKKGKITPTPEAVATLAKEDDANNFEPDSHTEPEAKKILEAKKLLEATKLHEKSNYTKIMRDAIRNQPERLKAAQKKKHDEEVYEQKLAEEDQEGILQTDDSNSDEDPTTKKTTPSTLSASKKTPLPVGDHKSQRSRHVLCRTGSISSENASSVNDSPHSNLDPSPHRSIGSGRKSYPPPSKVPLKTADGGGGERGPVLSNDNEPGMLRARTIEAINDIAPSMQGRTPVPFMYWQTHLPHLCATQLITRYRDLEKYAHANYHGIPQMAHRHALLIRNAANNERAVQIACMKKIWLMSSSKFALAFPLIPNNALTEDCASVSIDIMKLSLSVQISGLESVEELRTLIRSSSMYKNDAVFTHFCQGLESGMLKQSRKLNPTPLALLITIAHEAHFRAELWLHLAKATFRHTTTNEHQEYRKTIFNEFCELVAKDREDNEADASSRRLARDLNGDAEDAATETINPKFY